MELFDSAVVCHVFCDWENNPPRYRAYINDELFTERTWIWREEYLEELFQLRAPGGIYTIKYELVPPFTGRIKVKKIEIKHGPAGTELLDKQRIRIGYAST